MSRFAIAVLRAASVLLAGAAGWLFAAVPAVADDTTIAWSVSPADALGNRDGRTRLDLQLDPGATAGDVVTIENASTASQTFDVYGADAINTADGGYDLLVAGVQSADVGTWIAVDQSQVTIPALSSATVALTVNVPPDASAGDHAGGVVVSPVDPQPGTAGDVLVDSRVAVRLSVRVSGALAPALNVSDVRVGFATSLAPFGSGSADVAYTVRNSGNVSVVGEPRLRITGPFGVTLATVDAEPTKVVLPGQAFTVRTTVEGIAPALVGTAVVDVTMAAAPGPETEIPLVSSTARRTFAAVPWSGLALLVLLGLVAWWVLHARRLRREEGEEMWAELVDHAKAGQLPDRTLRGIEGPGSGASPTLLVALALVGAAGLLAGGTPPAYADDPPERQATVELVVPPAPSPTATTPVTGPSGAASVPGVPSAPRPGQVAAVPGADETPSDEGPPGGDVVQTPTSSAAPLGADTVWRDPEGLTPSQWGLVAVSGSVALGAAGFGLRAWTHGRPVAPGRSATRRRLTTRRRPPAPGRAVTP